MAKVIVLAMSIAMTSGAAQGVLPLQELTVPEGRLPGGCALSPADAEPLAGNRVRSGLWAGLPITTNPWAGTDRPVVAAIRARTEGSPRMPDGPPLTARELSRFRLRLADGVEEAYAAVYRQSAPELQPILVYALRFSDATTPLQRSSAPRTAGNPKTIRVTMGPIVAVVHGDGGECFQAVGAYLKSLAR